MLWNALLAISDEAAYFLPMLWFLASAGFDRNRASSVFRVLFVRQHLARCRNAIDDDALFGWGELALALHLMPLGLAYHFTCLANGACAQSNKICNLHLPSPGTKDDNDMFNIFPCCRLDVELTWFLEHFRIFDLDFLL